MASTDAHPSRRWRATSHLVVGHPSEPLVSMQPGELGWALPSVTVEGRQAPFDAEHGDVAHVREDARRELDVDATVLRCLYAGTDRPALTVDGVYSVEVHRGGWSMPDGARWVGRAELERLELEHPVHRDPLAAHLSEAESGALSELRPPWSRPGWYAEVVEWISRQLSALGREPTGEIGQRKLWEISCVLQVPTDLGTLYFKAACRSPLFADEPSVTHALAELFPGDVPQPLAVESDRQWMLLKDFGNDLLVRSSDIGRWEGAVRSFAQMQSDAAPHVERLLSSGCLDRRLDVMSTQIDGLVEDPRALSHLNSGEATRIRALVPELKAMCARLAQFAVPQTLVHGDLNSGNVALKGRGCVFFDWTDACVAHPFLDLITLLIEHPGDGETLPNVPAARERLVQAYLNGWSAYEPWDRLREAWALAEPLGWLHQAITYQHLLSTLESAPHSWGPAAFLRGVLKTMPTA